MEEIKQILDVIKKPLAFALRDMKNIETLKGLENLVLSQVGKLFAKHKFRLSVEMLLQDLRSEFKGFDRFDTANKEMILNNAYQIVSKLEDYIERGEDILLDESEIAREMKEKQKARAKQPARDKDRPAKRPSKRRKRPRRPQKKEAAEKKPQDAQKPKASNYSRDTLKFQGKIPGDKPAGAAPSGSGRGSGRGQKKKHRNRRPPRKNNPS